MTEKEKFISIKVKLLGIILPVICIIITVLTGLMYNVSKKVNQSNAQDLLKTSVEIQSAEIEAWLNRNLAAFNVMKQALEQFVETRETEGENLKADIISKLDGMLEKVGYIETRTPEIVAEYRGKLEDKVRELLADTQVDEGRIAAEVVILRIRSVPTKR